MKSPVPSHDSEVTILGGETWSGLPQRRSKLMRLSVGDPWPGREDRYGKPMSGERPGPAPPGLTRAGRG